MQCVSRVARALFYTVLVGVSSGFTGEVSATQFPVGVYTMRGTYLGTLSCRDCSGTWTMLTLNDPGVNAGTGSGAYEMVERFSGGMHGGETVTTRGTWFIVDRQVSDGYRESGTLELLPEAARGTRALPRFFTNTIGLQMQELDGSKNPVRPGAVLMRSIPQPNPEFGPLQIEDAGKTVFTKVGDTVVVSLSTGSSPEGEWQLNGLPSDSVALKYALGPDTTNGNGFYQEWTFSTTAPGKTVLTFSDVRARIADSRHAPLTFTFDVSK